MSIMLLFTTIPAKDTIPMPVKVHKHLVKYKQANITPAVLSTTA